MIYKTHDFMIARLKTFLIDVGYVTTWEDKALRADVDARLGQSLA